MKFANAGMVAASLLFPAAFAPAQNYDVTVRTDNPNNKPWLVEQEAPQSSTPKLQRVPVMPRRPTDSLGVYVSPVHPALAAQLRLKQKTGLVVEGIVQGGAAERAGIQQFDVITGIGGQNVSSPMQIERALSQHKDGEEVPVELIREGKHVTLSVAVQRPTKSSESDSNYRPVPQEKQKQLDEMSDKLKSELERQEKRIEELTNRIRAEAELAKKQIQELKEQLKRDAQQQKEQMLKDQKDRNEKSDEKSSQKPDKL